MATTKPRVKLMSERIRQAFKDAGDTLTESLAGDDVDGLMAGGDEDETGGTHIHIHGAADPGGQPGGAPADANDPVEARFQSLEQGHQQIIEQLGALAQAVQGLTGAAPAQPGGAPAEPAAEPEPEPAAPADTTKDSGALAVSFQACLADAEVLVPGFRLPTFDAALPRSKTIDHMCSLRRSVLDRLAQTHDGVALLQAVGDGGVAPDLAKLNCGDIASTFKAAAVIKKASNNRVVTGDGFKTPLPAHQTTRAPSPAELNKANAEFWAKHNR